MTKEQMQQACEKALEKYEWDYNCLGIRFEDKEREVGEICENSRHNDDRDDEREFPEYGTEEYKELFEFDGTSAWHLESFKDYGDQKEFATRHCYIIGGQRDTNKDDGLDDGEIVIENAVVLEKLF